MIWFDQFALFVQETLRIEYLWIFPIVSVVKNGMQIDRNQAVLNINLEIEQSNSHQFNVGYTFGIV